MVITFNIEHVNDAVFTARFLLSHTAVLLTPSSVIPVPFLFCGIMVVHIIHSEHNVSQLEATTGAAAHNWDEEHS